MFFFLIYILDTTRQYSTGKRQTDAISTIGEIVTSEDAGKFSVTKIRT